MANDSGPDDHDNPTHGTVRTDIGIYGRVPIWLYETGASANAVALFGVLDARWADRHGGSCFPSRRVMAEALGVSKATVDRALRELADLGALTVAERRREDGSRSSNDYQLRFIRDEGTTHQRVGVSAPVLPGMPTGAEGRTRPIELDPENHTDSRAGFSEFWTVYPRKVGKPKAETAWNRATRRAAPSEIMGGLVEHLPGWAAGDSRFIPHPTTWLNRDGWNDEPAPVEEQPGSVPEIDRASPSGRITL